MKCKTCRYWDLLPKVPSVISDVGTCRVNPPVIVPSMIDAMSDPHDVLIASHQPVTVESDWCGKYETASETTEDK